MNWHDSFIVALVEEDDRRLSSLLDSIPAFESTEEIYGALELISEATKIYTAKRSKLKHHMDELEKERKFLTCTASSNGKVLDIHS